MVYFFPTEGVHAPGPHSKGAWLEDTSWLKSQASLCTGEGSYSKSMSFLPHLYESFLAGPSEDAVRSLMWRDVGCCYGFFLKKRAKPKGRNEILHQRQILEDSRNPSSHIPSLLVLMQARYALRAVSFLLFLEPILMIETTQDLESVCPLSASPLMLGEHFLSFEILFKFRWMFSSSAIRKPCAAAL